MDADEASALAPPLELRRHAHAAGNGELLWPLDYAEAAARWAAGEGNGIWGCEVYAPRGPFTAMMIREWRTQPEWRGAEPWPAFVVRALEHTLAALAREAEADGEGMLYFLAYGPEATFVEDSERSRPKLRRLEVRTEDSA